MTRGVRHVALAVASLAIALGVLAVLAVLDLREARAEPDERADATPPPSPLEVSFELAPVPMPAAPPAPAPTSPPARDAPSATTPASVPRGTFTYSERLANEGLALLDDDPVVIRADYGAIGYEGYVAAMRALGGRAFVVSGRARPRLHLEIDPTSGAILSSNISARDVSGLAMNLPREIGREAEQLWRSHHSAHDVLDGRATSVVLVLPSRVEAYFRAALRRAVSRSGARFDDVASFRGRYEKHGRGVRLRLLEAHMNDGGRMETDILLDLAPRT